MKFLKQIEKMAKEKMIVPLSIAYFLVLGIADYLVCIVWKFYAR